MKQQQIRSEKTEAISVKMTFKRQSDPQFDARVAPKKPGVHFTVHQRRERVFGDFLLARSHSVSRVWEIFS